MNIPIYTEANLSGDVERRTTKAGTRAAQDDQSGPSPSQLSPAQEKLCEKWSRWIDDGVPMIRRDLWTFLREALALRESDAPCHCTKLRDALTACENMIVQVGYQNTVSKLYHRIRKALAAPCATETNLEQGVAERTMATAGRDRSAVTADTRSHTEGSNPSSLTLTPVGGGGDDLSEAIERLRHEVLVTAEPESGFSRDIIKVCDALEAAQPTESLGYDKRS